MRPEKSDSQLSAAVAGVIALLLSLLATRARADMYNNKTILVGDKGAAMGGAFAGIADDASATYYNPAGMTQLKNIKLNVSAQIVQYQKQEIQIGPKSAIPYNSFNFSPSITSFSQRMGKWAYGFSIVTPLNDLFRGETVLSGAYRDTSASSPCFDAPGSTPCFTRLNLSYYDVAKINLAGPSFAMKFNENISLGVTLYGIYYTELEKTAYGGWDANYVGGDTTDLSRFHENLVNRTVNQTGLGLTGHFGMLVRLPQGLSFGINASPGSMVWVNRVEEQRYQDLANPPVTPQDTVAARTQGFLYNAERKGRNTELTAPHLSLGGTWQPQSWLMLSVQCDYLLGSISSYPGFTPESEGALQRSGFEVLQPSAKHYTVEKKAVINSSGGLEVKLTKVYSVTLGGYTDFSQGPYDDRPASLNRRVDYYGGTFSVGINKDLTESRFGINAAWGDAAITHFQWTQVEGGHPEIALDENNKIDRIRRHFDAYNIGIFLSSTLKI